MAEPIQLACPECGEPIEVNDPTALVIALHMQNECTVSGLLIHHHGDNEG